MSYWKTVLQEVLHKEDPFYPMFFTNLRELQCSSSDSVIMESSISRIKNSKSTAKKHTQIKGKNKFSLGKKFPGIYFTKRESQIIFYFIQGLSTIEVAQQLDLSRRTVEFYTSNMKIKLNCRLKSDLVNKVMQSDFLTLAEINLNVLREC